MHSKNGNTPYSMFRSERADAKKLPVFACIAYVLKMHRGSSLKFGAPVGRYLDTVDHGVFPVLLTDEDGIPSVIDSRHFTFEKSKCQGATKLESYMDLESHSDRDYGTSDCISEADSVISDKISIKDSRMDEKD